jgi:hypothetical protein
MPSTASLSRPSWHASSATAFRRRFEEALCQAMLAGWARQQQSRRALVHDDGDLGPVARLVGMLDGYDLLVEPARLNGHVGAVMGLERELVLRLARWPVGLGDVSPVTPMWISLKGSVRLPTTASMSEVSPVRAAPAGVLSPVHAPARRLGTTASATSASLV